MHAFIHSLIHSLPLVALLANGSKNSSSLSVSMPAVSCALSLCLLQCHFRAIFISHWLVHLHSFSISVSLHSSYLNVWFLHSSPCLSIIFDRLFDCLSTAVSLLAICSARLPFYLFCFAAAVFWRSHCSASSMSLFLRGRVFILNFCIWRHQKSISLKQHTKSA